MHGAQYLYRGKIDLRPKYVMFPCVRSHPWTSTRQEGKAPRCLILSTSTAKNHFQSKDSLIACALVLISERGVPIVIALRSKHCKKALPGSSLGLVLSDVQETGTPRCLLRSTCSVTNRSHAQDCSRVCTEVRAMRMPALKSKEFSVACTQVHTQ